MKIVVLIFLALSLANFKGLAFADHTTSAYDLSSLTGKKTLQEGPTCYAHAMASVLEVELKQRNLLDEKSNISPESLSFIATAYPVLVQSRERLASDFGKRIFDGEAPFNSEEERFLEGGFPLSLLNVLPKSGFCLEGEWRSLDGLYDVSRRSYTHAFYKTIDRQVKKHINHLDEVKTHWFDIFYPNLIDSQKKEIIRNAVINGHYDYHRSFIDLFCSHRGKLLAGLDDVIEAFRSPEEIKTVVGKALRLKKAFIIYYNDSILYGTWAKNYNHTSAVLGAETRCEEGTCQEYLLLKNSNPAGLPWLNSITLARGWAKYRKDRCHHDARVSPGYCESQFKQDKKTRSAYFKNGLNYIRREIIEDAAQYVGYIRAGTDVGSVE